MAKKNSGMFDLDLDLDLTMGMINMDMSREELPDNPLDKIKYSGKVEEDSKKEMNAFQKAFSENRDSEKKKLQNRFDTQYYFCTVFSSAEQKNRFLDALGITEPTQYVDGVELAKKIKILLPSENLDYIVKDVKINKTKKSKK